MKKIINSIIKKFEIAELKTEIVVLQAKGVVLDWTQLTAEERACLIG